MGAEIEGVGTSELTIHGVSKLHGATYRVMPDRIEAATLMGAAAITNGSLTLDNCPVDAMLAVIEHLRQVVARFGTLRFILTILFFFRANHLRISGGALLL